jgi:4-aminobutyrate aminotransferase/(S)-3-amino-2-methylpropionate transaminase
MARNDQLQQRRDASIARGISNQLPVFIERAKNAELWDVEGRRYIDFASGIAVVNTGHVHPDVQRAVARQLEAFSHTCFMVTPYAVAVELAEKLNARAPGSTPKKSVFVTTGAEAVENAIKIARAHTGRSGVIAFGGGFHGRTFMAMALTGKVAPYKASFGPFPAEIFHAPFPIQYHGVSVADSLAAIDHIFKYDIAVAHRRDHHRARDGRGRVLHRAARVLGRCGSCATSTASDDRRRSRPGRAHGRLFAIEYAALSPT